MKSCLKSVLIAAAVFFAVGTFPTEEASAQGPIIRRMRERLNGGKAILPFVEDIEDATRDAFKRPSSANAAKTPTPARNTPARKTPTPARKTPTPARKSPTPARKSPTPAQQRLTPAVKKPVKANPTIKLESPGRGSTANQQGLGAKGFGMELQQKGDDFFVGSVDSRGNAAEAGLRRGDLIEEIGGAPIQVAEEFEAIAKAMRGGDRVEFKVSRRGSKAEKVVVQFGQPAPIDDETESPNRIELVPADGGRSSSATRRSITDRYEPTVGSGLNSIYDGTEKPSSILSPTPAPTPANRVESLSDLDFPALNGGK